MLNALIVAAILVCAFQAIRTERLLLSALWLASASMLVSLVMYLLGAPEVAVIELSVGAGLVTVLFVFAINIAGDDAVPVKAPVPHLLSWAAVLATVGLLAALVLPAIPASAPAGEIRRLATVLWEERSVDLLLQVVFIFAGVLGVLGLLSQERRHGLKEEGR